MRRHTPLSNKMEALTEKLHLFYSKNKQDKYKLSEEDIAYFEKISSEIYDKIIIHVLVEDIVEILKSNEKIESMLTELLKRTEGLSPLKQKKFKTGKDYL